MPPLANNRKRVRLNGHSKLKDVKTIVAPDWADVDVLIDLAKRGACTLSRTECVTSLEFIRYMEAALKETA